MAEEQEVRRGLSYSSFTEYSACARKYFLRKIKKVEIDSDADESTLAFDLGKFFHRVLEITKHDLKGFTFQKCLEVGKEFNVEDPDTAAMVYGMLSKYKKLHEISNLKVIGCEVVVDTPGFYGVADVLFYEDGVGVWIGDIKTAGTFQQTTLNTVVNHPQLLLYAKHYPQIAEAVGVSHIPLAGVRLRTTTKSKLQRKDGEDIASYIQRMAKGIKSSDISVPVGLLANMDRVYELHQKANAVTTKATLEDEDKFLPNFSNCQSYFRPCPYFSNCWGHNFTEAPKVEMVEV